MKTLFISSSFVAVMVTGAAIMIWQAEPFSSNQTSGVVVRNHPSFGKESYPIGDQAKQQNNISSQRVEERLLIVEEELRKLAEVTQLKPLSEDLIESEQELLAIEDEHREQEEDQRYIERLSTYYTELENKHSLQAVDPEWAGAKEEQIISSFETQSSVDNFDLVDIECRTNGCIIDFEQLASNNESDSSSTFFDWVLENTGNCEIHGEAPVASTNPEKNAAQRIHLVNCV